MIRESDKTVPKNCTVLGLINATAEAVDNEEGNKSLLGKRANRGYNPKYDSNSFLCSEGAAKV